MYLKKILQTPILYLTILLCIVTASFAFIIDNFTKNIAKDMISLWYESESINLQQGNYLSSVTKLERVIDSSTSFMSVF